MYKTNDATRQTCPKKQKLLCVKKLNFARSDKGMNGVFTTSNRKLLTSLM